MTEEDRSNKVIKIFGQLLQYMYSTVLYSTEHASCLRQIAMLPVLDEKTSHVYLKTAESSAAVEEEVGLDTVKARWKMSLEFQQDTNKKAAVSVQYCSV